MADVVRASLIGAEVIAATEPVAVHASQVGTEIITQTPGVPVRFSQAVLEVIAWRYVLHTDTVSLTAGATATVSGSPLRSGAASCTANATAIIAGSVLHEFTGWGLPV